MKRKLLCIFFMLAGAATIAACIFLLQGRPGETNSLPVYTLIILSVITIVAAGMSIEGEPDIDEISGRKKAFLWAFRAVGILAALACLAFIAVMIYVTGRFHILSLNYVFGLMVLGSAGAILAALSVKTHPPIIVRDTVKIAVALVIAAALGFIYFNYMPKYLLKEGADILRSNTEFSQKDVFYPTSHMPGEPDGIIASFARDPSYDEFFGDNPFFGQLYEYDCDSYGCDSNGLHQMKGYIIYNPANGIYRYDRTENQDQVFSPGEWPEFNWSFMYDKDGKHDAVLNLYFREWLFSKASSDSDNPILSVGSGEWETKLKDVIYPVSFPEDEVLLFLSSIVGEELKAKLLRQIEGMDPTAVLERKADNTIELNVVHTKDKTIEVYFFGIDIATYKNGEIDLKI